jgi:hypothetical protein
MLVSLVKFVLLNPFFGQGTLVQVQMLPEPQKPTMSAIGFPVWEAKPHVYDTDCVKIYSIVVFNHSLSPKV